MFRTAKQMTEVRAKNILAKLDLSNLPMKMKVRLVEMKDITGGFDIDGKPFKEEYGVQASANVLCAQTKKKLTVENAYGIKDINSEQSIRDSALTAVVDLYIHEMSEQIIYDGRRIANPHLPGYSYAFDIGFGQYNKENEQ